MWDSPLNAVNTSYNINGTVFVFLPFFLPSLFSMFFSMSACVETGFNIRLFFMSFSAFVFETGLLWTLRSLLQIGWLASLTPGFVLLCSPKRIISVNPWKYDIYLIIQRLSPPISLSHHSIMLFSKIPLDNNWHFISFESAWLFTAINTLSYCIEDKSHKS